MVEWLHALLQDICQKMAEFPERCSLALVAKCILCFTYTYTTTYH